MNKAMPKQPVNRWFVAPKTSNICL